MKKKTVLCLASVLVLSACAGGGEDVKEKLGLKSPPPDEFSVVTRAPLAVPPDYTLRPPRPGEGRPNELTVREQAKKTVFGKSDVVSESAPQQDGSFLGKLGATKADPNVRSSIDTEIKALDAAEQPAAEKLLFWKSKKVPGKTIDPVEEKKRLEASGVSVEKRNEDILQTP